MAALLTGTDRDVWKPPLGFPGSCVQEQIIVPGTHE